jgi:hypothetical protein
MLPLGCLYDDWLAVSVLAILCGGKDRIDF